MSIIDDFGIETEPEEAAELLVEYGKVSVRAQSNPEEHQALLKALEVQANGGTLINVADAITYYDFDEKNRPKLAIARADRQHVYFSWRSYEHELRFDSSAMQNNLPSLTETIQVSQHSGRSWVTGYSTVPVIPPRIVEAAGGKSHLRAHHVLWEVEQWYDRMADMRPDPDPYLLKRVHGTLFEIIAEWDVSPVEQVIRTLFINPN